MGLFWKEMIWSIGSEFLLAQNPLFQTTWLQVGIKESKQTSQMSHPALLDPLYKPTRHSFIKTMQWTPHPL